MKLAEITSTNLRALASEFSIENSLNEISYLFLNEDFFSLMRNDLTKEKLNFLSKEAKKIPIPERFGEILDEEHYLKMLELVLASTAETRHRGLFFLHKILPILNDHDTLLDIGSGDGQVIRWMGRKFNHVTAVDTNKKALDALGIKRRIMKTSSTLDKIYGSILEIDLKQNFYTLGVLSHVLYYIKQDYWFTAVNQVYQAIKPGGLVVIVLSGDKRGKADLMEHFGGEHLNVDALVKKCVIELEANIDVFECDEFFYARDITAMLHIAAFFLYDVGVTASRQELQNYVNLFFKKTNSWFELTSQQKFILIHK